MSDLMSLTPDTLEHLGDQFGIHYLHEGQGAAIARGRVSDLALPPGLHVTLSDLEVQQRYLSRSTSSVPWFLSVVLDGHIDVELGPCKQRIGPGQGLCAHFQPQAPLVVDHPIQPRLRTLNIAVLNTAPYGLRSPHSPQLSVWALPAAMLTQLQALGQATPDNGRQALVWHGLALQLLGHGLPADAATQGRHLSTSAGDEDRLARLYRTLSDQPMVDYTLSDLARHAAMSPSSLRGKFRARFGCTIFEHIRRCRLQSGYNALIQGEGVQQVAHRCGYRHASNFATAFKRQFGIAPTALARVING